MTDIVLMDGGMGQELLRRSKAPPHPLWSANVLMQEPHLVQAVHEDFIRAGARLITLNTYSTTPERLAREGVPDLFTPLQHKARDLLLAARETCEMDGVKIAACLPPLEGSYRPDMTRNRADLLSAYREIAEIQTDVADIILCETLSSINEAGAATQAGVETGLPTIVSLSLMDDGSPRLRSGEALTDALEALNGMGQIATMLNCSKPEVITKHLPKLKAGGKPIGAYANGFTSISSLEIGGTVDSLKDRKDLGPTAYAEFAMGWVQGGARYVGGCCEVGPKHISVLTKALTTAGYHITGFLK